MANTRNPIYDRAYALYLEGMSLSEVAKQINRTRQGVYKAFKLRGFKMRTQNKLKYIIFNNNKYTINYNGYYRKTTKERALLHRDVWEFYTKSKIPDGWDIHHLNENKTDNRMQNLQCLPKSAHSRLYSSGNNQYTKKAK